MYKFIPVLIISSLFTLSSLLAQSSSSPYPLCHKLPSAIMEDYLAKAPKDNSNRHILPSRAEQEGMEKGLKFLLQGQGDKALQQFTVAKYEICSGIQNESHWILLRPKKITGEALIVVNTHLFPLAKKIIIETPHTFKDGGTFPQSKALFKGLGAQAWIVSAADRCANSLPSGCDGTTNTCRRWSRVTYRQSDAAHNHLMQFHSAHIALSEYFSQHLVLSVHAMGHDGVSLSNGTTYPVSAQDPLAILQKHLDKNLASTFVSTCSSYPGAPRVRNLLCAETNVQGRHLNGVGEVCTVDAEFNSGRFIHMEQSYAVRRPAQYPKIIAAFESFLAELL